MISKIMTRKIERYKKIESQLEKLHNEITEYLNKKYEGFIDFDDGYRIGDIIKKEKILQDAQDDKDGTYTTYRQRGEDWGSGINYIPINESEYIEIYYST